MHSSPVHILSIIDIMFCKLQVSRKYSLNHEVHELEAIILSPTYYKLLRPEQTNKFSWHPLFVGGVVTNILTL